MHEQRALWQKKSRKKRNMVRFNAFVPLISMVIIFQQSITKRVYLTADYVNIENFGRQLQLQLEYIPQLQW
jgi:hypothetical protein